MDQSRWDYPGPFPMSFANSPKRTCKPCGNDREGGFERDVSIDQEFLVLPVRIELTTSLLPRECSALI